MMKISTITKFLFIAILFCACKNQQPKPAEPVSDESMSYPIESETEECMPCQMSKKCIALLAYGLLSEDEFDVPFGGACEEIASDSLITFLRLQKKLFKNTGHNEKINVVERIRQIEGKIKKCMPCNMPDCITILSYWLLSEEDINMPIDGVCKDVISDSVVDYLQRQKRAFRSWQKDKSFDVNSLRTGKRLDFKNDLELLPELIESRYMASGGTFPVWLIQTEIIREDFGGDYSFLWRTYLIRHTGDALFRSSTFDSLLNVASFEDVASHLDTSFFVCTKSVSEWCTKTESYAPKLKLFSKSDFSKEDFYLKYYDSRCKEKNP